MWNIHVGWAQLDSDILKAGKYSIFFFGNVVCVAWAAIQKNRGPCPCFRTRKKEPFFDAELQCHMAVGGTMSSPKLTIEIDKTSWWFKHVSHPILA